ncbi:hypothetical protein DFP72DRAFT_1175750 [Ephemerocybe angulata]|uniref:Uncharacterized protein n=1 Tax=Ephemerocybe angulata TaxID=980116 RepID=A0A8H6HFL0_9AGAR|nr:hypothetical protein DFP72DRAFT_1175750 [Tulosesus angulatus]
MLSHQSQIRLKRGASVLVASHHHVLVPIALSPSTHLAVCNDGSAPPHVELARLAHAAPAPAHIPAPPYLRRPPRVSEFGSLLTHIHPFVLRDSRARHRTAPSPTLATPQRQSPSRRVPHPVHHRVWRRLEGGREFQGRAGCGAGCCLVSKCLSLGANSSNTPGPQLVVFDHRSPVRYPTPFIRSILALDLRILRRPRPSLLLPSAFTVARPSTGGVIVRVLPGNEFVGGVGEVETAMSAMDMLGVVTGFAGRRTYAESGKSSGSGFV